MGCAIDYRAQLEADGGADGFVKREGSAIFVHKLDYFLGHSRPFAKLEGVKPLIVHHHYGAEVRICDPEADVRNAELDDATAQVVLVDLAYLTLQKAPLIVYIRNDSRNEIALALEMTVGSGTRNTAFTRHAAKRKIGKAVKLYLVYSRYYHRVSQIVGGIFYLVTHKKPRYVNIVYYILPHGK